MFWWKEIENYNIILSQEVAIVVANIFLLFGGMFCLV